MAHERTATDCRRRRASNFIFYFLPFTVFIFASSAPLTPDAPDDLIRQANAAFARQDYDTADRLYAAAEEHATDPGLVAFNRAAVLFQKGAFRDAELHYARALDDAACPPERAAKAWYNRGTCLLRRGGSASVYRSAVACLERCAESDAADEPLKAEARRNLEIAKVLWHEARKTATKPTTPNEPAPEEKPRPEPKSPETNPEQPADPGTKKDNGTGPKPGPQPTPKADPKTDPKSPDGTTPNPTPALPELENKDTVQRLSPEDAREHLRKTAARLAKDRHDLWNRLYGKDRPGVRDW